MIKETRAFLSIVQPTPAYLCADSEERALQRLLLSGHSTQIPDQGQMSVIAMFRQLAASDYDCRFVRYSVLRFSVVGPSISQFVFGQVSHLFLFVVTELANRLFVLGRTSNLEEGSGSYEESLNWSPNNIFLYSQHRFSIHDFSVLLIERSYGGNGTCIC